MTGKIYISNIVNYPKQCKDRNFKLVCHLPYTMLKYRNYRAEISLIGIKFTSHHRCPQIIFNHRMMDT